MKLVKYGVVAFLLISLTTCAHFVVRNAGSVSVKEHPTIGIAVEENSLQQRLSTLMVSSLMEKGFVAKALHPEEIIPDDILKRISPNSTYSFAEASSNQIAAGGSFKGKVNVLEKLLLLNDMTDSALRYSELLKLRDAILEEWQMDYVMFIYPAKFGFFSNMYNYTVKVIKTSTRQIVFTYYINANKFGWAKEITPPKPSELLNISTRFLPLLFRGRRADSVEVEFCEHVAERLIEEGGK